MKTTSLSFLLCAFLTALYATPAIAQSEGDWCGPLLTHEWKVVTTDTSMKNHLKMKVSIAAAASSGRYKVKIKDNSATKYDQLDAFVLECRADPFEATLIGNMVIDNCTHMLRIRLPYTDPSGTKHYSKIGLEMLTDHGVSLCNDHVSSSHDSAGQLRSLHLGTAHGEH